MAIEISLTLIILIIIAIIISALPLYFAVNLLGGDATILNVLITNIIVALTIGIITLFFSLNGLFILLLVILIYKFMFDLGIIKAFFAWILQYIIAFLLVILAIFIFGIKIPSII
jgi:hypothetical protein